MKKQIPKKLAERQENIKSNTLEAIQNAINDLKKDGFIVTKKYLREKTGFSNALFSKKHVLELLAENQVCQFQDRKKILKPQNQGKTITQLESQFAEAHKRIERLEKELAERNQYILKLKERIEESENTSKLLRGQIYVFQEKCGIYGIKLE